MNGYQQSAGNPSPQTAHGGILTAAKIAVKFRTTPSIKQLMEGLGMSRATAYRWRSAFRIARGEL